VRMRPGVDLLQYARDYHDAKALLLDNYVEGLHGGSGAAFDWSLIPRGLPLPIEDLRLQVIEAYERTDMLRFTIGAPTDREIDRLTLTAHTVSQRTRKVSPCGVPGTSSPTSATIRIAHVSG